jgi:hypothetical protein
LLNPGERIVVTDLVSGTTYYVKFVMVAPDGQVGEASAQSSLIAGFVLSTNIGTGTIDADMVSFDATAIGGIQQFVGTTAPPITGSGATQQPKNGSTWINTSNGSYYTLTAGAWVQRQWDTAAIAVGAINTLQIATGAITADSAIIANAAIKNAMIDNLAVTDAKIQSLSATKLTAGTIDASVITVNNLNASNITAGTLTGRLIQTTGAGATRVTMAEATATFGADAINFYNGGSRAASLYYVAGSGDNTIHTDRGITAAQNLRTFGPLYVGTSAQIDGAVQLNSSATIESGLFAKSTAEFSGAFDLPTDTGSDIVLNANKRLRRKSSTQRVKYDITPLSGTLHSGSVDPDKLCDVDTTGDLHNVLDAAVVEFSPITEGEPVADRYVGFIAEDMVEKFPAAIMFSPTDGSPEAVRVDAVVAALLAVVRDQRDAIADLTARVEALEG